MKNSYSKIIAVLIVALGLGSTNLKAQNERSLFYMRQIPQASYANPAFLTMFGYKSYENIEGTLIFENIAASHQEQMK